MIMRSNDWLCAVLGKPFLQIALIFPPRFGIRRGTLFAKRHTTPPTAPLCSRFRSFSARTTADCMAELTLLLMYGPAHANRLGRSTRVCPRGRRGAFGRIDARALAPVPARYSRMLREIAGCRDGRELWRSPYS